MVTVAIRFHIELENCESELIEFHMLLLPDQTNCAATVGNQIGEA